MSMTSSIEPQLLGAGEGASVGERMLEPAALNRPEAVCEAPSQVISSPVAAEPVTSSHERAFTSSAEHFNVFPPVPPRFEAVEPQRADPAEDRPGSEKISFSHEVEGRSISFLGLLIFEKLMEVAPLRSKTQGNGDSAIFPLPTSIHSLMTIWPGLNPEVGCWINCVCASLNSLWGGVISSDKSCSSKQKACLELIRTDVERFCELDLPVHDIDWQDFFSIRGIDYKGDEIKVARWITWDNIAPALPREIGKVPLEEVCTLGCREYVLGLDSFLKPKTSWGRISKPRVMVEDGAWPSLCTGLLKAGVCCLLEVEQVFDTGSGPLLNGLFGVSKEEWTPGGVEICRLIMNLTPFNAICQPLGGDVDTLPSWGMMSPFFLQPDENLLVSSEDVKCFFYTMQVPPCWCKFLAFNKMVPDECLPPELKGKVVYLASQVLPMGFLNSVSLAQNVHRNLVRWSVGDLGRRALEASELRKDRPFTVANPAWRVYLDRQL